jgi:uncharacterized glyoxalase superfamily protein PhnB
LGFAVEFAYGQPASVARVYRSDWSASGCRVQFQQSSLSPPPTGLSLYFEVGPGIDALCDRYRALGVHIEHEPQTMPWGLREFTARDCNGVLLRFATPSA